MDSRFRNLVADGRSWARPGVPIILDTDMGGDIDDALALAFALQSPELDVRAVTTVSDDTTGRARVAWKELGLYGRQDIPVAAGAPESLLEHLANRPVPAQFKVLTPQDVFPHRPDSGQRTSLSRPCWPRPKS